MSTQLLSLVAKKALGNVANKNSNSRNPMYDEVRTYTGGGKSPKIKKIKKQVPVGLSANDKKILEQVRKQAYFLDMSLINCCGIRVGWSSVVGILPVLGDFLDMFMAYMVVKKCGLIDGGLPPAIQYRMFLNIAVDFGVGLIPFVGDIADALFRANTRNACILEEYLIQKLEAEGHSMKNLPPSDAPRRAETVRPKERVLPGSYEQVREL